jgi:hypothetical protein
VGARLCFASGLPSFSRRRSRARRLAGSGSPPSAASTAQGTLRLAVALRSGALHHLTECFRGDWSPGLDTGRSELLRKLWGAFRRLEFLSFLCGNQAHVMPRSVTAASATPLSRRRSVTARCTLCSCGWVFGLAALLHSRLIQRWLARSPAAPAARSRRFANAFVGALRLMIGRDIFGWRHRLSRILAALGRRRARRIVRRVWHCDVSSTQLCGGRPI